MKYLAAYLLLVAGGNTAPTSADIKKVIAVVGGEVDDVKLAQLMTELEGMFYFNMKLYFLFWNSFIIVINGVIFFVYLGKDIDEIIAAGKEKLIPIASGGGGAPAAAAAGGDEAPAAAAAPKEEEVDALEGGMDMFGGGGGDY